MNQKTLICSVGGSYKPIVTAIDTLKPDFVLFVCSEDDPASGAKGSYTQITDSKIKARPQDPTPTLDNIPTQAGLDADQYDIIKVEPDSLDDIYVKTRLWIEQHQKEDSTFFVDYTGGTKSMSAALVLLAMDENLSLQLVTGDRVNHVRVESGETVQEPQIDLIRFNRAFKQALEPWQHYAYDEALDRLKVLRPPQDRTARAAHGLARAISEAMSAWDRFEHQQALDILQDYNKRLGRHWGTSYYIYLSHMLKDAPGRTPWLIMDLWNNAQRRAHQHRYDDATARLYRLLEWTIQWLLEDRCGILTADVPPEKIPEGITLSTDAKGRYQAPLIAAWELAACLMPGSMGAFWETHGSEMKNLLQTRNHSILAHGFRPVSPRDYHHMAEWIKQNILPLILENAEKEPYKLTLIPQQLPTELPANDHP